ncbi:MAG: DUF3368 domain-containing protein [Pirellulales bacterium]|nr:DUF3368 domain-containing protein [Pirellulales bacterium]
MIETLGIILRAKRRKLVNSASEIIRALVSAGFRVDDNVIAQALIKVGETWLPKH